MAALSGFYISDGRVHHNVMEFVRSLSLKIRFRRDVSGGPIKFRKVFLPSASFSNRSEAYSVHTLPASLVSDFHLRDSRPNLSEQPVFLSRSKFSGDREIQNQAELENALEKKGFRIVYPEQLNLAGQIALFNRHLNFFGCWGSAFHDTIFSRAPSSIATHVLCHCIPNANFLMFDSILKNKANYVRSMYPIPGREQVWPHLTMTIDVEQVLSYCTGVV
jgi:hypothetical protein